MNKSRTLPRTIRRIAARRTFKSVDGKPVVLTIGVPRRIPGSDWGCALQITGLKSIWRRPKYVFGIDGVQALHLALKCAAAVLESTKPPLTWLGEKGDLGMPKFLPDLPKPHQERLDAIVEREVNKFWRRRLQPTQKAKTSTRSEHAGRRRR
jgi:hypothetical protein